MNTVVRCGVEVNVDDVSAGYGAHDVLRSVSWRVSAGRFCGIIGPNGAGKSTLVRVLGRILAPRRGMVRLDGHDIKRMPAAQHARLVAIATRVPEYARSFTVREFMLLGRYPFAGESGRTAQGVIEEALRRCDAAQFSLARLSELSSGEVQRVAVAQAIAQTPRLLLLDEPTAHLDIAHQVGLLDFIRELTHVRGLTVVGVFHDLNLASEYCDELLLLSEGRRVRAGSPAEVLVYDILEAVYRTAVVVKENPISGKPYVFPVPASWARDRNGTEAAR